MKTVMIEIPKKVEGDIKYEYFPKISKMIMEHFYDKINQNATVVSPRDPKTAKWTYYHKDNNGLGSICKCKLRIDMPATNKFMIDTKYVKQLEDFIKERKKNFGETLRGLVIFPVVNERKIYIINVEKINKENTAEQYVNNTYSESKHKRQGEYYVIEKCEMAEFEMPETIKFYRNESELKKSYNNTNCSLF